MPLVIGVDSSTQSTKVEVRDADNGKLIATGRAPHPSTNPPRSEQDPESWWAALRSAIAAAGKFDVAAISRRTQAIVPLMRRSVQSSEKVRRMSSDGRRRSGATI